MRAEANRAHAQGKLITLHAEGLDPKRVPLPFNTLQSSPVTDRAKVFAALARRGVRGSGAATSEPAVHQRELESEAWEKVLVASDKALTAEVGPVAVSAVRGALDRYLENFPDGRWSSKARRIRQEVILIHLLSSVAPLLIFLYSFLPYLNSYVATWPEIRTGASIISIIFLGAIIYGPMFINKYSVRHYIRNYIVEGKRSE